MRLLLDHCLPRRFKHLFPSHEVKTAVEMGWEELRNGRLLAAASAAGIGAMLTIDKNLKHQQNLSTLSVVVILSPTNRLKDLTGYVTAIEDAIRTLAAGQLVEVAGA